ncbi:putative ankyrin repeat protein RF_0381 [Cloeon dipterum]|uniref:putative ankyrin repeat protein RF_0381 n=1 Tax=Cloeon dipterum TaxID=197152 RepID=UPI003220889D
MVAARDKDLKTCKRLVNEGADPKEVSDCGLTLLHFAAINQDHGVDIYSYFYNLILDREDVDGEEPIHYALRKGDYNFAVEMLRLRKAGADNLLHYFVMHNNLDFAKLVLERDPDLIRFVDNRRKTLLHFAAQYANRSMCEWLVGQKLAPDAQSDRGSTPMHFAMRNRQHGADLASFFASKVPKWNKTNKHGLTPLHWALQYENLEAATRLLDLGCSIRIITKDMMNLLHFCAAKNKLKSAKLVHRWNGNLIWNSCLDGMTALHFAARNGDVEFCKWLIVSGVDIFKLDNQGRSALDYVNKDNEELQEGLAEEMKVQESYCANFVLALKSWKFVPYIGKKIPKILKEMELFGVADTANFMAKINDPELTPLMVAAKNNNLKTCMKLVHEGENPKQHTAYGLTLLHFAAINEDHGVNIYAYFYNIVKDGRADVDGEEPIHYALRKANFDFAEAMLSLRYDEQRNLLLYMVVLDNLEFVKLLYNWDSSLLDISDDGHHGKNLLHFAAQYGSRAMCEWLVRKKFSPDSKSDKGSTPLHFAMRNKRHAEDLVLFFTSKVVNWDVRNKKGQTPLHWALQHQKIGAARRLIDLGANLMIRVKGMQNFMHFCAEKNKLESAKLLHRWNGNLIGDSFLDGLTALHLAVKNDDVEFCEWLIEAGVDVQMLDNQHRSALDYVKDNTKLKNLLSAAMNKGTETD